MFLHIKRSPGLYLQHKNMDAMHIAPITSSLRINMNFVSELSVYTLKEDKTRKGLDSQDIVVPAGTQVIHLEMSYTHSTHVVKRNSDNEHTVNERYYYKLIFFPGADAEFGRIKSTIDRLTEA